MPTPLEMTQSGHAALAHDLIAFEALDHDARRKAGRAMAETLTGQGYPVRGQRRGYRLPKSGKLARLTVFMER